MIIFGDPMEALAKMSPVKPLVLVIEDDAASGEALALILRDWGADVVIGASEREIHSGVGARWGDLSHIITDFHLGAEPDGITLVRRLTQSAPQARVLVLSGSFQGRATAAAARAGFEVMNKPARAGAIVAWLERA
jgi:DNA-binding NtrC family response regulator